MDFNLKCFQMCITLFTLFSHLKNSNSHVKCLEIEKKTLDNIYKNIK